MNVLNQLNARQHQAVEADDGPVLIVAGPGTGKTKTLTARVAYLLTDRLVKPDEIVALTFTNKAAREMRQRLGALCGGKIALPKVTTFHAIGRDILQQTGDAQPLLSESDRQEIIRVLARPTQFKSPSVHELGLLISHFKTAVSKALSEPQQTLLARYEQALRDRQMHDFDDLLVKAVELLQAGKAPRYTHVLVDEFQDTSELQYVMLRLLAGGQNIFAIGDPNQSIYAFRGAGAAMFERFRADFPGAMTIALTSNYRSRPEVVVLANAIFPGSPRLVAESKDIGTVRAVQTLNEYSEADYILAAVEQGIGGSDLLKANSEDNVREPRDYAVLYRTHRAGKVLQETFAAAGIPYQVAGEGSPYELPAIQAVIAVMRYLYEPAPAALPKLKNFSENQMRTIADSITFAEGSSVCDLAVKITLAFGLGDGQHFQQFRSMLVQFGADLGAAVRHIDSIAEQEFYDTTVNAVTLLTIHAAKGLEFGHVFVIAAEEGILPKLSSKGDGNIDEEHRLFYVAVTRAKDSLEILHTKTRAGKLASTSRFVDTLPKTLLPRTDDPNLRALEKRLKKRAAKRAQSSLF